MSILENLRHLKTPDLTGFVPVTIDDKLIGWTKGDFARLVNDFDSTWVFADGRMSLSEQYQDFDSRTKAIDDTFMALSAQGHLPVMPDYSAFGGVDWFDLVDEYDSTPLCIVKRFYMTYLGAKFCSTMLNGYKADSYWTSKRSYFVDDGKGQKDIVSAGAIIHGQSLLDCIKDEAGTEAGLNAKELSRVQAHGALDLYYMTPRGFLSQERFHIFDLDMQDTIPETHLPHEVEGFELVTNDQVVAFLEDGTVFKHQLHLVVTDFMLRHGVLDQHPEYNALKKFIYHISDLKDFVK